MQKNALRGGERYPMTLTAMRECGLAHWHVLPRFGEGTRDPGSDGIKKNPHKSGLMDMQAVKRLAPRVNSPLRGLTRFH